MQQPPLRAAYSSPFIHTQPSSNDAEKENSTERLAQTPREYQKLRSVQFNTGCSSSSSDLSQLAALYNESADQQVVEQWTNLYKRQRGRQPSRYSPNTTNEQFFGDSAASSTQSVNEEESSSSSSLRSAAHGGCGGSGGSGSSGGSMHRRPVNRSLDVLPTIAEGFRALEKCVSVEFSPKTLVLPSQLVRSKEMPNLIAESEYE